jgi:hypothetical protein
MKKSLIAVRVILMAVLILAALVAIAIEMFAERALKIGIEVAATEALDVRVNVGKVDLKIYAGKFGISNLVISNPPGYQYDKLLELKDARIKANLKSLLGQRVDIKEVKIDGINIFIEQKGVFGNNLKDVTKTASERAAAKRSALTSGQEAEGKSEEGGKKLHINNLEMSNVTVKVKLLPVPGKADTITFNLDPIVMTGLGADNELDAAGLFRKILAAIQAGVADKGTGILPEEMTSAMKSTLDTTIELGQTATKEGKKLLKESKGTGEDFIYVLKSLLKKLVGKK